MKVKLRSGKYLIPVNIREVGARWELQFPFSRGLLAEVKIMQGAKWHGYDEENPRKIWSIKKSPRNVFQLSYLMGNNPYRHYDTEIVFEDEWPRIATQGRDLYEHQKRMVVHVMLMKRCLLACEMGTGKTLVAIVAMENLNAIDNWYVGPVAGVRAVNRELNKWQSHVRPRMMTYAGLVKLLEDWPDGMKAPGLVIFDESSKIKTPTAQRSKAALHLANAMRDEHPDPTIILMSGTPAPKSPIDWWHQCEVACPGFLKEGNVKHFRNRLAIIEQVNLNEGVVFPKIVGWHQNEVERLYRRMKGLVLVQFKKDCLDLPEKIYEEIKFIPTPQILKVAKLIRVKETRAVTVLMKLRELSDGFQYDAEGNTISCGYETPKDDALREYLDLQEDEGRIVIWAGFTATIDKISQICKRQGWKVLRVDGRGYHGLAPNPLEELDADELLSGMDRSDPNYDKLLDRHPRIAFVGHPQSGGMALTLTSSSLEIFYSNVFNGEARMQAEDRCHRPGMTKALRIVDLLHLPTDKLVLKNLKKKKSLQNITMGELSEWI